MSRVYLRKDVNTKALEEMFETFGRIKTAPRALKIIKGGETVVRMSFAPYEAEQPMYLYSLSKPFTSIAVGICCDMGLLSPDMKLCDIFPDKMPAEISEWQKKQTIADLLTMRCGHGRCIIEDMRWAADPLKTFFEFPMQFEPGTTYVYSTAATCVCAAAVERVTGTKTNDFLYEHMFRHLGINKPEWRECADGTCLGGTGLLLNIDEVAAFLQMLLQRGVYNGKRIVSEEYLDLATSKITDSYVDHISKDWSSGYGFQFWQNGRGGFRGDGAYGQIGFVLPDEDTVLVFFGESFDSVAEFDAVNKMLDELYTPDAHDEKGLEKLCESLYTPEKGDPAKKGVYDFKVAANGLGITRVRLEAGEKLFVRIYSKAGKRAFLCGNGEYVYNRTSMRGFDGTQVPLNPADNLEIPFDVYASYRCADGKIEITLRHADTCHMQVWTFDTEAKKWLVTPRAGNLCVREFDLI